MLEACRLFDDNGLVNTCINDVVPWWFLGRGGGVKLYVFTKQL
jgi:hypothetical protein